MDKKILYKSGSWKRAKQAENERSKKKLKDSMQNFLSRKPAKSPLQYEEFVSTPSNEVNTNACLPEIVSGETDGTDSYEMMEAQTLHEEKTYELSDVEVSSSLSESVITIDDNNQLEVEVSSETCNNISNANSDQKSTSFPTEPTSGNPSESYDNHLYDFNDPALWPPITDTLREYFILNKPSQNIDQLKSSKQTLGGKERMCSANNFYRMKKKMKKKS